MQIAIVLTNLRKAFSPTSTNPSIQSINIARCKEKLLQPAQSVNLSHLSVVAVLPVDLLQGDSLAVEVRIKGAATDLSFEGLKKQGIFTGKVTSNASLGMPSDKKSAVFLKIVQKAFEPPPPPFYLNICPILRGVFFKTRLNNV